MPTQVRPLPTLLPPSPFLHRHRHLLFSFATDHEGPHDKAHIIHNRTWLLFLEHWRVDALDGHRLLQVREEFAVPGRAVGWEGEGGGSSVLMTKVGVF